MRILIADSAPRVRSALRLYIEQCRSDVEILEAESFNEVQCLAECSRIEVALIDWHLPEQGGKAALRYLRRTQPDACVIVLSGRPEAEGQASDADAFISKGYPADRLRAIFEQRESCRDRRLRLHQTQIAAHTLQRDPSRTGTQERDQGHTYGGGETPSTRGTDDKGLQERQVR